MVYSLNLPRILLSALLIGLVSVVGGGKTSAATPTDLTESPLPNATPVQDGTSAATPTDLTESPLPNATPVQDEMGPVLLCPWTDLTESPLPNISNLPVISMSLIFWPSFKNNILSMSKEELIEKNWVTEELKSQIMSFGPLQEHIQVGNNARNKDVLEQYCGILFPKGRMFASRQQLFQAAKIFSAPGAYQTVHVNHQFMCSYGKDKSRKNKGTTLKDDIKCPFTIRYTIVGYNKREEKAHLPALQFMCKITSTNYAHTCPCTPVSHRVAQTVSHKNIPSAEALKQVIHLMHETPTIDSKVLRKHLASCLPGYQELSAKKLAHFLHSLRRYIFQQAHLGVDSLQTLGSSYSCNDNDQENAAYLEYTDIVDDPIMHPNFQNMLRTLMQGSDESWMVLQFLEQTQEVLHGFKFKIRHDDHGRPTAILWMTPEMHRNAAHYSNSLFLDAQKRQFNLSGWPYIASS
jgi:hypothetical protein